MGHFCVAVQLRFVECLTAHRGEPRMRLQLQMASTGTSSSSHGHRSEPEWCKPAWHDEGEWTREPRSERAVGQRK
jgi:hypothetical protein